MIVFFWKGNNKLELKKKPEEERKHFQKNYIEIYQAFHARVLQYKVRFCELRTEVDQSVTSGNINYLIL